jgi:hypothetical protein
VEWPLPLGEEGEKQEVDDPERIKQPECYKANNDKRKARQVRTVRTVTYRRQGMLGVEVASSQICNFMILGESSKHSNTFVEILLLHKIFRYSRRILQARKSPQLGGTMLQGLNSTLQEIRHELSTRKCTSSTTLQLLDAG